jgi:hypothetical protein
MRGLLFGRSHQLNDRFGYWISGSLKEDAGYLSDSRFRAAELYTKFGWDIRQSMNVTLYSSARRKYREEFIYWNGLNDVLNPGSISLNGETASGSNDGISDRLTILPVFRHSVSESVQYTLKGRLFGVAARPFDSQGNIRPRDRHNTGIRYGGEAQVDVNPTDRLILTGGFTFDENYIRSDIFIGEDSLTVRNQPEGAVFVQADAMAYPLEGFDFVHASPACQHFSPATAWRGDQDDHPDLLTPTRRRLDGQSAPWVVENVPGAPADIDWDRTLAYRHELWSYGLGVAEAEVQTQGDRNIIVSIPKGTDEAQAREQGSGTATEEFIRKSRVVAGAVQFLSRPESAVPRRNRQLIVTMISHKALRWLSPLFAFLAIASSAVLAVQSTFFQVVAAAQILFLLVGLTGDVTDAGRNLDDQLVERRPILHDERHQRCVGSTRRADQREIEDVADRRGEYGEAEHRAPDVGAGREKPVRPGPDEHDGDHDHGRGGELSRCHDLRRQAAEPAGVDEGQGVRGRHADQRQLGPGRAADVGQHAWADHHSGAGKA